MIRPGDEVFQPQDFNQKFIYNGPFKKVIPIAEHYGFSLLKPIFNNIAPSELPKDRYFGTCHKNLSIKNYLENKTKPTSPQLVCYTSQAKKKIGFITLEIFDYEDSFAETLLLQTAYQILLQEKYNNLLIEINSFGSSESHLKFELEIEKFVKRNLSKFPPEFQHQLRVDPMTIFDLPLKNSEVYSIMQSVPRPVSCLSELCRLHLKNILENLEALSLPYQLSPGLFPHLHKYSEVVYTIKSDIGEILAYGENFSKHARQIAELESELHAVSITIKYPAGKKETYEKIKTTNNKKFFFAHTGALAKRQSLTLIEELRNGGLEINHSFLKNSLREQLFHSEKLNSPYVIILVVKEAQENTVIVRDNMNNIQHSVAQRNLVSFLKKSYL